MNLKEKIYEINDEFKRDMAMDLDALKSRKICIIALIIILVICVFRVCCDAVGHYNGYNPKCPNNILVKNNICENDIITLCGTVEGINIKKYQNEVFMSLTVNNTFFNDENGIQLTKSGEKILVNLKNVTEIRHGQKIIFKGKLKYFSPATNWGEFDAYKYYRNKSFLFSVESAYILKAGSEFNHLYYYLWCAKNKICTIIDEIYMPDNSAILKAMLLGVKNELSDDIRNAFQKSGIAHILAISGLHISFICMLVYKILNKMGLHIVVCSIFSGIFLLLYIIMIGFSTSACRAAIMFVIFLGSRLVKRSYDIITALACALIIISTFNKCAIFDGAVVLSFLAVLGIGMYLGRLINNSNYLKTMLKRRDSSGVFGKICNLVISKNLRNIIATLVVSLITLPAILYSYYEISLYSWVLNMLLVPLLPIILVAGSLSIIVTAMVNIPANIFTVITCVIIEIYKKICITLEKSGLGRRNFGKPTALQITLYIVLISVVLLVRWRKNYCVRFAIFLAALMILLIKNDYGFYMLDVGQGDCFVAINQNNEAYIFDGGSTSRKNIGENVIIPFLKSKGVSDIRAVFVSHPDEDHMNGVLELIESGREECLCVDNIVLGRNCLENGDFAAICDMAKGQQINILKIGKGDIIRDGMMSIECIYPEGNLLMSDNNNSLVLRISFGDLTIVETGDLEKDGENIILQKYGIERADILKIGHHGSSGSTGSNFLEAIQPKVALISAGRNNRYGHPHSETLELLKKKNIAIVSTKDSGACRIKKLRDKISVEVY